MTSSGFPYIKVERQTIQSGARGAVIPVIWDTITAQSSEWGFSANATDVAIPQDGTYLCSYHLAFLNASGVTDKAVFLVDGVVKMAQEFTPNTAWYQSMYMTEMFSLTAGSIISCGAFVSGSGTMDFGPSSVDTSVFTSLSLTRLPVG